VTVYIDNMARMARRSNRGRETLYSPKAELQVTLAEPLVNAAQLPDNPEVASPLIVVQAPSVYSRTANAVALCPPLVAVAHSMRILPAPETPLIAAQPVAYVTLPEVAELGRAKPEPLAPLIALAQPVSEYRL